MCMLLQAVQVSFMAKEWVDHALSKTCEAENKLELSDKAYADSRKRHKETLFHLVEVEKARKNVKLVLARFKKQAKKVQVSLRKAEMELALAIEKTKQQQK